MSLDTIRVSEEAKNQLITLKRRTGLEQWNYLCRWAFCVSLAESNPPPDSDINTDSSVEMTWKTFGGDHHHVYRALLKQRLRRDGIEITEESLENQFTLHLHRGIGYLVGEDDLQSIEALVQRAI
jgi:DNA sulfur modification protein DndE